MSENENEAGRGPAQAALAASAAQWTAAMAEAAGGCADPAVWDAAVREVAWRVQLALSDLSGALEDVRLTPEGVFTARCPVHRSHTCLIRLNDEGRLMATCPTCRRVDRRRRFEAALAARFPHIPWERPHEARLEPLTRWVRQPEGAPAIALRRVLYAGEVRTQWIAEPGREAEVERWLQS